MGRKSTEKGRRGEQDIAARFRRALGGSWGRRGLGHSGTDLVTPDGFPWAIEVKNYSSIAIGEILLLKADSRIEKWLAEACKKSPSKAYGAVLVCKFRSRWFVYLYGKPGSFPEFCPVLSRGQTIGTTLESFLAYCVKAGYGERPPGKNHPSSPGANLRGGEKVPELPQ